MRCYAANSSLMQSVWKHSLQHFFILPRVPCEAIVMRGVLVFRSMVFLFLLVFSSSAVAATAFDMEVIKQRCAKPLAAEPVVYNSDFEWHQTVPQMKSRFERLYESGKRLFLRGFYDREQDSVVLQHSRLGKIVPVPLTEKFIKSVTLHVERALKLGYVSHVFFADMGHAHVHIPQAFWDDELKHVEGQGETYRRMFAHPGIRLLYHTAEQLQMTDGQKNPLPDRHLQWRLYTRNLVGDNRAAGSLDLLFNPDSALNTAHGEDGYRYWGAGFDIHSTKNGCFPYLMNGKTHYFDLSLASLPARPGTGTVSGEGY